MDKSEYRVKLDQITALVNAGDYANAQTIVDEVDWRRVKSARTLCMVSEIYEENDRLPDSRKILELAYKRALIKTVAYRLVEICLKLKDVEAAQDYYEDFTDLAPMDNSKYILKYKIHRAKGDDLSLQIKALEEYKEREYTEPWAYELAKLYSQNGDKEACVDACDDLILWFSEGPYVLKAMELKKKYVPLSPSQQEKYKKELAAKDVKTAMPVFLQSAAPISERTQTKVQAQNDFSVSSDTNNATPFAMEEEISAISTEEAIEKMDAAASSTVQAESGIKLPFGKVVAGMSKPALDPARMQNQLVDSIRNVFAGINNKGTVQLDTKASSIEENYKDSYKGSYDGTYQEDMSGYEIKDLEPETGIKENVSASDVVLAVSSTEEAKDNNPMDDQIDGQMSFDDFTKKESEFDFEALFAETTSALARELASGTFEKEKVVNTEEEAEKVIEEEIARIVAEEVAAEKAETKNTETKNTETEKDAEDMKEQIEEAVLHLFEDEDASEGSSELYGKETDESLGLTKEFSFKDQIKRSVSVTEEELLELPIVEIPIVEIPNEELPNEEFSMEELSNEELPIEEFADSEEKADENVLKEVVSELDMTHPCDEVEDEELVNELETVLVSKESVTQEAKQEKEISADESSLILDPEQVVLQEEEKTELEYLPLEPRPLTAQEKEIFTYFSKIPGLGEQITVALSDVHNNAGDKTSKSGNFLVIGRQGSGKTRLYESMVLAICKDLGMDAAKNAKIIARDFNHKDPAAVVAKLAGGFLAIEGAGELSDEAAEKLAQAMEFRTDSLVVVLEDEKEDLMQMLEKHPRLAEKFTTTIKIPVFTNDELVAFARIYALDQGYRIDEMGVLALYTKIGDNQKDAEPITVGKVKEMMDEAMLKANKGHRKLSRRFSKNATDEDNRIILFEKDFE